MSINHSFRVGKDGEFTWESRKGGYFCDWGRSGNPTLYPYRGDHELVLRVEGQASQQPIKPGSKAPPQPGLNLHLEWTHGSGTGVSATPTQDPIDYRLSSDGKQMTTTVLGSSGTYPHRYAPHDWQIDGTTSQVKVDGRTRTTTFEQSRDFTQTVPGGQMKLIEKVVVVHKHRLRADLSVELIPINIPVYGSGVSKRVAVAAGGNVEFNVRITNCGPDACPDGELQVIWLSGGASGVLSWVKETDQGTIVEQSNHHLTVQESLAAGASVTRRIRFSDIRPAGPYDEPLLDPLLRDAFTSAFEASQKRSQQGKKSTPLSAGAIQAWVSSRLDENLENDGAELNVFLSSTTPRQR
uniref:Uncharacterized protein n=1 Tax=Schlesneria paludicola TaxID=360056 RepID=A0A7C2NYQ0_9PLAN